MRAALYIRVSTEEQRIHGLSIQAQREALDEWAENNRVRVVGHYIDAGISARKKAAKRPELQRLLSDVRDGRVDLVVFTKLDRWFRNVSEYYKVQDVLESHGVNWKTIHEDYDTSTASGRLKINIMLSVAQDEADRTGERIKAVHASKVLRGEPISGKVPLGYRIENKKMIPDPDTAAIAQDIFREYIAIRSVRALRRYIMDAHGLAYASDTGICELLKNERYIGRAHGMDDFCEPIIERETFDLVQSIIAQRAQRNARVRTGRVYLFTGLVFCAECGNRLSAHVVSGGYIYYRCTRYEKLHLCSHKKRTSERVLERWLLDNLLSTVAAHNTAVAARPSAKVDVGRIKAKMEKLKDLYLNDLIDRDAYERDYTALRAEIEAVEPECPREPIDMAAMKSALSVYSSLTAERKKEFWTRTVSRIVITNDDVFSVILI